MLIRHDAEGVIAIGQPSHAWISGQLARAWGNDRFGVLEPWEEVCLAAEQHDIGMAAWDLEPTRNPATGLPHSFTEMPIGTHLALWSAAPRRLLAQSRYAALLVSMHGRRLYARRNLDALAQAEADSVRTYLDESRAFGEQLLASLRADSDTARSAGLELVERNSQLLWTWDSLSLGLCLDWAPFTANEVPTVDGAVDQHLAPAPEPGQMTLDPWPFAVPDLTVRCEGRRLNGAFETTEALLEALERARWETLEFELRPL
jgi:Protein of unknown function (DUF3891)